MVILTQLYYTLECFARKGICPNDLHLGYVFIRILDKTERTQYVVLKGARHPARYRLQRLVSGC
jgi:hypothetical protein